MPQHVDTIITAEISNWTQFPELYDTIVNCMLHGPCRLFTKDASYMKDGKCSKGFLKEYTEQMNLTSDGYPRYQWRDNSASVMKGGFQYMN